MESSRYIRKALSSLMDGASHSPVVRFQTETPRILSYCLLNRISLLDSSSYTDQGIPTPVQNSGKLSFPTRAMPLVGPYRYRKEEICSANDEREETKLAGNHCRRTRCVLDFNIICPDSLKTRNMIR